MRLLTVDPSIRAMGVAMFIVDRHGEARYHESWVCEAKLIGKNTHWMDRLDEMVAVVFEAIYRFRANHVVIEMPPLQGGFYRQGRKGRTGDILKLMGLVFSLRQMVMESKSDSWVDRCELVLPMVWKGQVKKHITRKRVLRKWGLDISDDNECDAVGIGDWYLGVKGMGK